MAMYNTEERVLCDPVYHGDDNNVTHTNIIQDRVCTEGCLERAAVFFGGGWRLKQQNKTK